MNRIDFTRNFALNMEIERINMGLSQEEMAYRLDIAPSTYKRIVYGKTNKIDAYLTYKLYLISDKLTYEYVDYYDDLLHIISKIKYLDKKEQKLIDEIITNFLKRK